MAQCAIHDDRNGLDGFDGLDGLDGLGGLGGLDELHKNRLLVLPGACFNRDQRVWNSSY